MRKQLRKLISTMLVFSLLFTLVSCKDKKEDENALNSEIVEVVETYFGYLSKCKFSKIKKMVSDSSSFDKDWDNDESDLLDSYLATVQYEITKTTGGKDDKRGQATVKLTFVDLDAITTDLKKKDGFDVNDIIDGVKDKKAPTTSEKVKITLTQDDGWTIKDDETVYDALMYYFEDAIEAATTTIKTPTTTTTEETTTEATTAEITTQSTEETTVPTTKDTDDTSDTDDTDDTDESFPETKPHPGLVDKHVIDLDAAVKVLKSHGYEVDLEGEDDEQGFFTQSRDQDYFVMYLVCKDKETFQSDYLAELDDLIYGDFYMHMGKVTDQWNKNTHNIYSENNAAYNGSSIDLYVYYDEDTLVLVGIQQLPQADPPEDYYIIVEQLGLWDFGIDYD